jgi:hypothetical protein
MPTSKVGTQVESNPIGERLGALQLNRVRQRADLGAGICYLGAHTRIAQDFCIAFKYSITICKPYRQLNIYLLMH